MSNDQRALVLATTSQELEDHHDDHDHHEDNESPYVRDVHALTPPRVPRTTAGPPWETSSNRSSSLSVTSSTATENFTSMSREFSALVLAGSTLGGTHDPHQQQEIHNLSRIREEDHHDISQEVETNPLAIVPDNNPTLEYDHSRRDRLVLTNTGNNNSTNGGNYDQVSVQSVKKEEVESKISAWANAKIAKINNRFKREDAIINGWESEQVQQANSWMKKIERKLEEKRAKALEKMQNDIAKARRKAEERRASAEAKRGTKVAKILEISNLMRAVGRPPVKRSFF